jgi:hypothetical protein
MEFTRHTKDYIKMKITENQLNTIEKRSEFPDKKLIKALTNGLNLLYPDLTCRVDGHSLGMNLNIKEKLFLFGKIFGVSTMLKIIDDHRLEEPFIGSDLLHSFINDPRKSIDVPEEVIRAIAEQKANVDLFDKIELAIKDIKDLQIADINKQYRGQRKAYEVSLPNPSLWSELNINFDHPETYEESNTQIDESIIDNPEPELILPPFVKVQDIIPGEDDLEISESTKSSSEYESSLPPIFQGGGLMKASRQVFVQHKMSSEYSLPLPRTSQFQIRKSEAIPDEEEPDVMVGLGGNLKKSNMSSSKKNEL